MKISKDQIVLESTEDRELIFESLYLYYLRCRDFAHSGSLLFCKRMIDGALDSLTEKVDEMAICFDDVTKNFSYEIDIYNLFLERKAFTEFCNSRNLHTV